MNLIYPYLSFTFENILQGNNLLFLAYLLIITMINLHDLDKKIMNDRNYMSSANKLYLMTDFVNINQLLYAFIFACTVLWWINAKSINGQAIIVGRNCKKKNSSLPESASQVPVQGDSYIMNNVYPNFVNESLMCLCIKQHHVTKPKTVHVIQLIMRESLTGLKFAQV